MEVLDVDVVGSAMARRWELGLKTKGMSQGTGEMCKEVARKESGGGVRVRWGGGGGGSCLRLMKKE